MIMMVMMQVTEVRFVAIYTRKNKTRFKEDVNCPVFEATCYVFLGPEGKF